MTATDVDLPAQLLSYTFVDSPPSATLDVATGHFSWTPGDAGVTNVIVIRVTDNGSPAQSATVSFRAGVAPTLRVTAITLTHAGEVTLVWDTLPGKIYRVEFKPSLDTPSWDVLGGDRLATGAPLSVTDPMGGNAQRLYRVRSMNP